MISLAADKDKAVKGYELATDLMLAEGQRNLLDDREQGSCAPLFYSKAFLAETRDPKTSDHMLGREELLSFA